MRGVGVLATWAAFGVAALAQEAPRTRIAFGSCVHQDKAQPVWDAINAFRPDLFVFAGDNIYGDTKDMAVLKAKYAKLAGQPGMQKLKAACPILATWDDHDYGWNDAGAEYPHREASQQIFLDFFGFPKDSPVRSQQGIYSAHLFGPPEKRLQVILLDTRYHRSPLKRKPGAMPKGVGPYEPVFDQTTTVLGEAQWKWLADELKKPAKLRLVVTSIQAVSNDHTWEKWGNFPHERDRLFRTLRESQAEGIVLLSGDRHHAEISVLDNGYPLFDVTSSGLNQGFETWRMPEANKHRVSTMFAGDNFGAVVVDWDKDDPIVRLQIRDETGELMLQERFPLSLLKQGSLKAGPAAGPIAKLDGEPFDAQKALAKVKQKVTVEMKVLSTGTNKAETLVFLNSAKDRKSPTNFTVVLDKACLTALANAGVGQQRTHFEGKSIRIVGTLSTFQNAVQLMVTDPKQITIVP